LTPAGRFSTVERIMKRGAAKWLTVAAVWLAFPQVCPAPLIYTPGEGWHYEVAGSGGKWTRSRAQDQLAVAQEAFAKKDYALALKAARRTVNVWPFADYAPNAQYLIGRCLEEKKKDEAAFKAYQTLIERYPKLTNFAEIIERQFDIANRFLDGQWFKLWNTVPLYPSMDKTIKLYEQIIKNGPYSAVAPKAQLKIAVAYERKLSPDYASAAKAYERAADRYNDKKEGVDGLYSLAMAYNKQANTAEYDQSIAAQAIATYTDFATLHPEDSRVPQAQEHIKAMKAEQARGSFDIALYYEKKHKWKAASIYYNEVIDYLRNDPNSKYASQARERIEAIQKRQRN
jgi:outer membrane protein assembly factor BamD